MYAVKKKRVMINIISLEKPGFLQESYVYSRLDISYAAL